MRYSQLKIFMFKYIRPKEQEYAFVPDVAAPEVNRYGKRIETISENDPLRNQSLNINGDAGVGENPNRYKQHGFYLSTLSLITDLDRR